MHFMYMKRHVLNYFFHIHARVYGKRVISYKMEVFTY